jgi:hypothetical protein
VCLVSEEGVELHDVGVGEEALNLDLPHQLHQQLRLHVPLRDPLQSADETRIPMTRHEDFPELPRP